MDERTSLNKRWNLNNWTKTWAAVEAETQDRTTQCLELKPCPCHQRLHQGPPPIHPFMAAVTAVIWNKIGKRHPLQYQNDLVAVRWAWWFFIGSMTDRWQILFPGLATHLTLSFATQQQSTLPAEAFTALVTLASLKCGVIGNLDMLTASTASKGGTSFLKWWHHKKIYLPLYWSISLLCHPVSSWQTLPGSLVRDTSADPKCQTTSGDVTFPRTRYFKAHGLLRGAAAESETAERHSDVAVERECHAITVWTAPSIKGQRFIMETANETAPFQNKGPHRWWWVISGRLKAEARYLIWWSHDTDTQPSCL